MDNPNPIYYKDLITPDNSIENLLTELDDVIAKYDTLKQKIQTSAAAMTTDLGKLSGATNEQRDAIASLSAESEKLVKQYTDVTNAEREQYRLQQQVKQADKEKQQIDKLLVQINNSKESSYNRLSAQYRLNKIRLNEMTAEERRTVGVGKELEDETRRIYEEMSRLQKATGKYTLEVGHYENALRGLPGPINQVVQGFSNMGVQISSIAHSSLPLGQKALQGFTTILSGTIGMVMLFVRHLTGSAKLMREFEQANANLATILGVTRDEMKALTDSALQLGKTTEYTASQVTQLQTELAKLGFGQGSIIAMQEPILQFATAVGANLADAASVAGSTLRAFNLTSADTEDVLATLAVATNKSALSFDRISQSIGTVFPVANAFGLSVKDTTALLGALANAGFEASNAATATRNIILNLADANGKLAKAMGGPAKNFDEIIDGLIKLRESGTDLNDALELTDKRSVAAFSALLSGAELARELRASLEDVSGELKRIQEERLNTVEGSTKLLKSAWEGLTLSFQKSNGAIKQTIDNLTELVSGLQRVLFATESAQSSSQEYFVNKFQNYYKDAGADLTKEYMTQWLTPLRKELDELAQDQSRKGKKAYAEALNRYKGYLAGYEIIKQQIANDEQEAARQAGIAAEQTAQKQIELTKEEKKAIEAAKKQRIADRRAVVDAINTEIAATTAGTEKMLELRLDKVEAERQLELEQNRQKVASERQDEEKINAKYDKMRIDTETQFNKEVSQLTVQRLQAEQQAIQLEIAITKDGTEEMLNLRLENIEKQRQIELEQNRQKAENVRQDEKAINAKYDALRLKESADFNTKLAKRDLDALQDLQNAEFDLLDRNERQKTIFRLQQEKARLEAILELDKTASEKMTDTEIAAIKATIAGIEKETKRLPYNNLYELLGIGLDNEQQNALNTAIASVKDSIGSIIESWNQAADAALNAANAQVEAAQKALEAQIEARNAGYANEVETAQKELELAKKNQQKAQQDKQKAQQAQARIDTLTQTSSLITASANIWAAMGGIPIVGPALAIASIAAMWGSFALSKIKAAQVAGQTEQYGEGTVELLDGGSHASGNDIDMGYNPKTRKHRRAEGGEFFAVINKRNSRKYRNIIPDVINSFNNGTFADRYQRANENMDGYAFNLFGAGTDVSRIEKDVSAMRKNSDTVRFVDGQGNTIVKYKNLTRKILN